MHDAGHLAWIGCWLLLSVVVVFAGVEGVDGECGQTALMRRWLLCLGLCLL